MPDSQYRRLQPLVVLGFSFVLGLFTWSSIMAANLMGPGRVVVSADDGTESVALGDFNLDGFVDMAIVSSDANRLTISLGGGDGTFVQSADLAYFASTVVVGSFNPYADGWPDLAIITGSTVVILLGDGHGDFNESATVRPPMGVASLTIGDFNGDGAEDLVIPESYEQGRVAVVLGDGLGGFGNLVEYSMGRQPWFYQAVTGDFDRSGTLDVAIVNFGYYDRTGSVFVMLGDGRGGFRVQEFMTVTGTHPVSLAAGDFDSDGYVDLAVGLDRDLDNPPWLPKDAVSIYTSHEGYFGHRTDLQLGDNPFTLAVGDLNGDGHPDIVAGKRGNYCVGTSVNVLLGNGSGDFSLTQDFVVGKALNVPFGLARLMHPHRLKLRLRSFPIRMVRPTHRSDSP